MNLNEMKKVVCSECKQRAMVNFYYSDPTISEEEDYGEGYKFFMAKVNAQAMCPNCGNTISTWYHHQITPEHIIKLALLEDE